MHVILSTSLLFFIFEHLLFPPDQVIVQGSRKMRIQRIKHNNKFGITDQRQHHRQRQQRQQERRRHQQQQQPQQQQQQDQRRKHHENLERMRSVNKKNASNEYDGEHNRRGHHRGKRSISSPRHVEALIVADPSMVAFHQDGDVETYLLTIMNMVSSLYKDPAIGNLIKVVVVRIVLLEEDETQPDFNVTHLAENNLHNFCRYTFI